MKPSDLSFEPFEYHFHINDKSAVQIERFPQRTLLASILIPNKTPLCCCWSNIEFGPLTGIGFADGSVFLASDLSRNYDESCFLRPHKASVLGVSFHATENKIASASLDGTYGIHVRVVKRLWQSSFFEVTKIGLTSIAWKDDDLIVGDSDGTIRYMKYESHANKQFSCIFQTKIHSGYVRCLSYLRESKGADIVSNGDDSNVAFLKINDNQFELVSEFKCAPLKIEQLIWDYRKQFLSIIYYDSETKFWKFDESNEWISFEPEFESS